MISFPGSQKAIGRFCCYVVNWLVVMGRLEDQLVEVTTVG